MAIFSLEFPQSLGHYDTYAEAQKAVDFLSDHQFPVENCLIVGTELKQLERVTGRLTNGRVAAAGAGSGAWFGLFIGVVIASFSDDSSFLGTVAGAMLIGIVFGVIWALVGYRATRGQRDFSSVSRVEASKYEVLVEHKHRAAAQELLATMPGAQPNPFA